MKHLFTFLSFIFFSSFAFNQIYFQTAVNEFEENNAAYEYIFTDAPSTGTMLYNPKLHIRVRGDFNSVSKGFELYDKDDNLIHAFNNLGERCQDSIIEYTMTEAEYLSYIGTDDTLAIQLKLTDDVDPYFCDRNYVYISLEVNYCQVASPQTNYLTPTITFYNDSYCTGQGVIDVLLWPIGGILSGEGVVQNGLNFHISSINLQADTIYEYLYTQTNQDGCEFIGRNSIKIKKSPDNIDLTICAGSSVIINTPAKWYSDAQRTTLIGNGTEITPTHTAGSHTYYLDNYQFQSYVELDTLTLTTADNIILKDATDDNAIPAGGFAVTPNYLYLGTGDTTIVYNAQNLNVVRKVEKRHSFFSDLATGKLFTFYNTEVEKAPNNVNFTNGIFNAIAELDANLQMTGIIHPLAKNIKFDEASSVAAGFGEVFFSNSQNQSYIFELSTFTIRDFYAKSIIGDVGTNIFSYGFMMRDGGDKNVYFKKGMNTIRKINIEDLSEKVVGTFNDSINAVSNITFSPWSLKWYLSNSTNDELSSFDRVVVSADANLPAGIIYDTLDNCVSEAVITIPSLDSDTSIEVCEGAMPYTYTASVGFDSYTWNGNAGDNTYVFNQGGTVMLEAESAEGCVITEQISLAVVECVGVEEVKNTLASVYPNPTKGNLTVSPMNEFEILSLTVVDLNGRQLSHQTAQGSQSINLSTYVNGIYLLMIENENGQLSVEKIIKE